MSRRIFLTADWHIARSAWKNRPEIHGDALNSLKHLMDIVTHTGDDKPNYDVILGAGDLFDMKNPSSDAVVMANKLLASKNFRFAYIQGQHERSDVGVPWMELTKGTHANFDKLRKSDERFERYHFTLDLGGMDIHVYAMDWCISLHLQDRLDEIGAALKRDKKKYPNAYNILMLHQTCNAVMAGTGDARAAKLEFFNFRACELNDGMIPHGFDCIVCGDTHQHAIFELIDKEGYLNTCYSPGSLAMQTVAETNTGQCFVLEWSNEWEPKIYSQTLYRRPYEERNIENPVEFDKTIRNWIKAPVTSHFDRPIIRFSLYENDADRKEQLIKACEGKCFPFIDTVKNEVEELENELFGSPTDTLDVLISTAINEADATIEAKQLLTDLISGDSADEVLDSYYKAMVKK